MKLKSISSACVTWTTLSFLTFALCATMNKPRKLYSGYKLLKVDNITSEYEDVLIQTLEHRDSVQIWRLPKINETVEMLVGQSRYDDVMEFLREIEVTAEVVQEDISVLLNEEREKFLAPSGIPLTWTSYHSYEDIVSYFRDRTGYISSTSPVYLSGEIIGKSDHGRDIYLFKVSKEAQRFPNYASGYSERKDFRDRKLPKNKKFKPALWIDAGLHGRDWLSIAACAYILDRILSGDYEHLLEEYDFYFIPLINPDGYEYTRTIDRFWAKNLGMRKNGRGCEGVNLDRNFALMYRGELMEIYSRGTGVAHNPCSDFYGGTYAHIEPEVTALSRAMWARRESISLYISLQSYSQLFLIPREPASKNNDFDKLVRLAEIGSAALEKSSGVKYNISSWDSSQAEPPGKCIDWMKQIAGIKYSYGIKLRDDGKRAFLIPATQIQQTGEELLAALQNMALAKSAD